MLLYVLVLTASLCCLQVKSYPYMTASNYEYEEQLEGPKSPYDQQIDDIVEEMGTCMNSTLTESGFMNQLDANSRLMLENIGLSAIRNYLEQLFQYINQAEKEKESTQEVKEYDFEEEEDDDSEYLSEYEEEDKYNIKSIYGY